MGRLANFKSLVLPVILLGLVWASGVLGQTLNGFPKIAFNDPYWFQKALEWKGFESPGSVHFEHYWGQLDSCGFNLVKTYGDSVSLLNPPGLKLLNANLSEAAIESCSWYGGHTVAPWHFADGEGLSPYQACNDPNPAWFFGPDPENGERYRIPGSDPPHYVYRALVDQHSAGTLIHGSLPRRHQFRYRQYYLTFRLKMVGDTLEHIPVARIKVWCIPEDTSKGEGDAPHNFSPLLLLPDADEVPIDTLFYTVYADDFHHPGSYEDITFGPDTLNSAGYYTTILVQWLGTRDLYIDNVFIRDIFYYYAWEYQGGGYYSQEIKDALLGVHNINPALNFRWYKDEPPLCMFSCYHYVDSLASPVTARLNGALWIVEELDDYRQIVHPNELIFDKYTIWGHSDSSSYGGESIQISWNSLTGGLRSGIKTAQGDPDNPADDIPFWMTVQACDYWYEDYGDTMFHSLRSPTANELKAEVWLSLCYGAKGIMYFMYPTEDWYPYHWHRKFRGLVDLVDADSNFTSDPKIGHYVPNYKWYVVRDMNAVLDSLNPVIQGLTWVDAGKWDEMGSLTGSYINSITSDRFPQDSVWVEVGLFHDNLYDYFMLVNRRCLSTETQQVTVELSRSGLWAVKDMYSGEESWLTSSEGVMSFTTTLGPGEGKLFRLREGFSGPVLTDQTWEGLIGISGDITVPDSVTLTINPGTALRFFPGGDNQTGGVDTARCELIVEGSLLVQGTEPQPVTLTSFASTPGDWWGIRFKGGSWGHLRHALVEYGYCGVLADSGSTVTIDSCTIQKNEVYGVRCDHAGGATTISGNRIWNNGVYGVWTEHCSPDILDNLINGSRYGIKASYAGSDMLIKGNSIDNASIQPKDQPPYDNYVGISLQNSSPLILDNEIGGGKGLSGLSCSSGSNPEVRSCIIDARCKKGISCYDGSSPTVDSTQVHSYTERGIYCYQSSYPRLGDTGIEGSGGNSISSRDGGYEVWCEENLQPVMAESCWWGMAIPDPSRFHGAVDWLPCLDHDPFGEVGVEDGPKEGLPTRFTLFQNYPNPFNPTTLIRYSLPVARQGRSGEGGSRARTTSTSYVSLKVYNILGQEVRTLVDEPQAPGYYQVRWDGRDNLGREVSSGIYFYRLQVLGDRLKMVKTRKMVLIR